MRAETTRRIKQLGRQGKPREAVAELANMAKLGIQVCRQTDPATLFAALGLQSSSQHQHRRERARRARSRRGPSRALPWHPPVRRHPGMQPDTLAATALLDACCRNGKMEMARSVFAELFDGLLAPDEVVFAVMLRGYGAASERPQWNEISSTLQQMEQQHGIQPSIGERGLAGGGRCLACLQCCRAFWPGGHPCAPIATPPCLPPPCPVTYNALLECCTKHNDGERAGEIMGHMLVAGVQPDDFTLEAVRPRRSMRSLLKRNFNVTF